MPEEIQINIVIGGDLVETIHVSRRPADVDVADGLRAAFAGSVKSASDFERQLSAIKVVKKATKRQMRAMRKKALQLGKETSFSAAEAAEGMQKLIDAGLSLDEVLGDAGRAVLEIVEGVRRATPADPSEMNDD